jgi:hypothetical protein
MKAKTPLALEDIHIRFFTIFLGYSSELNIAVFQLPQHGVGRWWAKVTKSLQLSR